VISTKTLLSKLYIVVVVRNVCLYSFQFCCDNQQLQYCEYCDIQTHSMNKNEPVKIYLID